MVMLASDVGMDRCVETRSDEKVLLSSDVGMDRCVGSRSCEMVMFVWVRAGVWS